MTDVVSLITRFYRPFIHSSIINERTTKRTTDTCNVGGRRYGDPMNVPTADELAEGQAALNEYLANMIMGEAFNELRYVDRALTALVNHNLAAGFGAEFAGEKPPDDLDERERYARAAVDAVESMDVMSRWDAKRAQHEADQLQRWAPDGAAPLSKADGAALVYLIIHAKLAAVKVGIADTSGLRLAQHRRKGWQILAVFQVSAQSAAAIETDVLKWWRGALGLPSYLRCPYAAGHVQRSGV
jgi:hypothetical protein